MQGVLGAKGQQERIMGNQTFYNSSLTDQVTPVVMPQVEGSHTPTAPRQM